MAIALRVGITSALSPGADVWLDALDVQAPWDPTSGYRAGDFGDNVGTYLLHLPNYLGFIFSADRGLLWWCPLLFLLLPATGATGTSCRTGRLGWRSAG
ncbi:hypothetical protein [Nocardioides sp. B-3]|uniref:hypothetical protein n=1 Tax=Nocardioides sp. B-3 TaxID=2895565 RepID=UPI0021538F15|nr:hypothetical protein [Nocardioides sp. B-3]UUZ59994.1 hypothetical protein LP418_02955 [Nocardioides sp. B-3]